MERARTLMRLHEVRCKVAQQESAILTRSRERVDAIVERYAKADLEKKGKEGNKVAR